MVAAPHLGQNVGGLQLDAFVPGVFRFEGPSREPCLVAARLAAITGAPGGLADIRIGQGVVTPIAGAVVGAMVRAAAHGDTRAHAASEDDGEHDIVSGARSVDGFRGGETVSVVLDPYFSLKGV